MSKLKFSAHFVFFSFVLSVTLLASCQRERDTWGGAFVPDEEKLQVREYTTSQMEVWTDTTEQIAHSNITRVSVGEIYDPIFGQKRSYLLSQYIPNSLYWKYYDAGQVTLDSAFFGFRIQEVYQEEPLLLTLSQLEKPIELSDTAHKAAVHKSFKTLATVEITPKKNMLVRIPLDKEVWARTFLDQGKKHLSGFAEWLTYNPGFRLDVRRKLPTPNKGAMMKLTLGEQNTGLFFYWKKNDTVRSIRLGILKKQLKRFVGLERDFTGTALAAALKKSHTEQDAELHSYVESAGDVRTVIDLTKIYEQWRDSLPVTVMRAELQIPLAAENAPFADTLITRLYTTVKSGDVYVASPDVDKGKAVYDGYYNRQAKYYSLNLTYTIQGLLLNQLPDNKIYLLGSADNLGFGRAILNNGKATTTPMKLKITYTRH